MTAYLAYPPAPAPADPLVFTHIDPAVQAALESRGWKFATPAMSTRYVRREVIQPKAPSPRKSDKCECNTFKWGNAVNELRCAICNGYLF